MRFHVVSLPHTQTTEAYAGCAYTEKVRKFCIMMKELRGHEVFLYAGEQNEAPCDELIPCISEAERAAAVGKLHYTSAPFDNTLPHWRAFNGRAAAAIAKRAQPKDFLCVIGGWAHKPIADALPALTCVEFGIGYGGTFAKWKVFESYAWMHVLYGAGRANGKTDPHSLDGLWFDAVIPGYVEMEKFPYRSKKEDYYLFIGRLVDRKGYRIAADVCEALGKRLIIAGTGTPPTYGEYVGQVGPERRGELMSKATAVFVPTIYIEPFGNVAVEAMACGTPVITTDWGAFTETVIPGVTGYRCRTFQEFIDATEAVKKLDSARIKRHVQKNYALPVIAKRYEEYFNRLNTLWDKGWYQRREEKHVSDQRAGLDSTSDVGTGVVGELR